MWVGCWGRMITLSRQILRVEITPLRDSPETHHIVSRPSSNGIKPAIMYQQQTRSSPSVIKSPQSGKSPLPTTRITSRGREINLPTRFLRWLINCYCKICSECMCGFMLMVYSWNNVHFQYLRFGWCSVQIRM